MGMKMPPALAVVEGMAGAIAASANASPYAKPSVLLPKAFTNRVATRSPSPVFSKPCRCPGLTKLGKPVAAAVFLLMQQNQGVHCAGLSADKGPTATKIIKKYCGRVVMCCTNLSHTSRPG